MRFVYVTTSCISFSLGFYLYLLIEAVYKRNFSTANEHWSMGLLAGFAFVFLLYLDRTPLSFWKKAFGGAVFITVLELIFGIYLNLYRGLGVWDYSRLPFHFLGQICPLFSLVWFGFSCIVLYLNRFLLWEVRGLFRY